MNGLTGQKNASVSAQNRIPVAGLAMLALVFGLGLFVAGFDQGHMLSLVFGEQAFADMYVHELTHDMRHAAGFPCH